ncbi:MAG: tRNA pseudouridine(55) synthase TruB [Lachnospiraceae bacterium]|nr:tRNA pseudouridine(55) synthase TruB [Lachnospiraceae bacterium]
MISGIINVYKEKGYTSHDVVAKLRGILHQKKIGHTGTLDPEAEGVLPVCLGSGTKLCDMLTDKSKTYQAVLLLGQNTDTQDTTGTVLETREVTVTEEEAEKCILGFVGEYSQIPPMYSALKVDGKKLYELARAGIEVERKPRQVSIHSIEIQQISLPEIVMTVSCSKGTYIRTLCYDIGQKLGCGGCMKSLKRIRVGSFAVSQSRTLDEIRALQEEQRLPEILVPVDAMFPETLAVHVLPETEKYLKNGNPLQPGWFAEEVPRTGQARIRIYDTSDRFCAIYQWNTARKLFIPEKMFLEG